MRACMCSPSARAAAQKNPVIFPMYFPYTYLTLIASVSFDASFINQMQEPIPENDIQVAVYMQHFTILAVITAIITYKID